METVWVARDAIDLRYAGALEFLNALAEPAEHPMVDEAQFEEARLDEWAADMYATRVPLLAVLRPGEDGFARFTARNNLPLQGPSMPRHLTITHEIPGEQ